MNKILLKFFRRIFLYRKVEKMTNKSIQCKILIFILMGVVITTTAFAGEPGNTVKPNVVDLRSELPTHEKVIKTEQPVDIYVNSANVEVAQPIDVEITPEVSVKSKPVTIVATPNVSVYQNDQKYSIVEYEPVRDPVYDPVYKPTENVTATEDIEPIKEENALDRLKDGLCDIVTFWSPFSAPNTEDKNPTALQSADGYSENGDQFIRNFIIKAPINSARKLGEGAWKTATFPFPKAS